MSERKYLLPHGLTKEERDKHLETLVRKRCRRGMVTSGYVLDVYPDERGWVSPGTWAEPWEAPMTFYAVVWNKRATEEDYYLLHRWMERRHESAS